MFWRRRGESLNDFKSGTSTGRFQSDSATSTAVKELKERKKDKRSEQGYKISKASIFLLYVEISTISTTSS